jgi:octaprenyl-diphosphate synthase
MNVRHIVAFVTRYGGIDYAVERAREFSRRAQECLETFPDSASKQSLLAFAEFVVKREK